MTLWGANKTDVTSDVIGAMLQYIGDNAQITVNTMGKPTHQIVVHTLLPNQRDESVSMKTLRKLYSLVYGYNKENELRSELIDEVMQEAASLLGEVYETK